MTEIRQCTRRLVLLAEGDEDLRATLQEILENEGYQVALALGEDEALRHLENAVKPSLVLLDLSFETAASGRPLLKALCSHPQQIPIVALTSDAKSHPEGAVATLRKPFEIRELLEVVARYSHPSHAS